MIFGLYSIRDNKTAFMSVTTDFNDQSAIRNLKHAMENPESLFVTHAADFDLYKLGEFDSEAGVIVPCSPPLLIASAASLLNK